MMSNSLVCLCWNIHLDSALPHSYPAAGFHLLLFSPHSLKTSSASPTIPYLNCHQAGTDGYFGLFSLSPVQFQQAELPGVFPRWMGNPSPPAAPPDMGMPWGWHQNSLQMFLYFHLFIHKILHREGCRKDRAGGIPGDRGDRGRIQRRKIPS